MYARSKLNPQNQQAPIKSKELWIQDSHFRLLMSILRNTTNPYTQVVLMKIFSLIHEFVLMYETLLKWLLNTLILTWPGA